MYKRQDYFDVKKFGADFAYTVDGGECGELEYENFNAASVFVDFTGLSIHPLSLIHIFPMNIRNVIFNHRKKSVIWDFIPISLKTMMNQRCV